MAKTIDRKKLQDVCKIGSDTETCAFITCTAKEGFSCAKADPALKAHIQRMVAAGKMRAKGDNCPGNDDD